MKTMIAVLWAIAVSIAGIAGNVNSLAGWTILGAVALAPPLALMRWWRDPHPSMSQSIREALR
jgi:hypothetical protein